MDDQGLELTDDEREWCKANLAVHTHIEPVLIKLQARGDRAEFYRDHDDRRNYCERCDYSEQFPQNGIDPRHTWKAAQWIEAAKQALADTVGSEKELK